VGAVAWDNLMEDLATLEISRTQVWQWLRHQVPLDDGPRVTTDLVERLFEEELVSIIADLGIGSDGFLERSSSSEHGRYREAATQAHVIFTEPEMRPFLACASDRLGDEAFNLRLRAKGGCS
jgi:malate synthase